MIITATSACSALGDAPYLGAAIRAGLNRFAEDPLLQCLPPDDGTETEPARAVRVASLGPDLGPAERLAALASHAGRSLMRQVGLTRAALPRTALLLGLPGPDPVTANWNLAPLARQVAHQLGLRTLATSETLMEGRLSLFTALTRAATLLNGGNVDRVLVLVADSLVLNDRFRALDAARRIRSMRSPGGMLPGEAGVGFAVSATGSGLRLGAIGMGHEPQPLGGPQMSSGGGMTAALTAAACSPAAWVLPDLTGEDYRTREWAVAMTRLMLTPIATTCTCAHLGDAGAANPALALLTACAGFARGWGGSAALICAGADDGTRAAVGLTPGDM